MNVLMIALHYHDYADAIADELRGRGHTVVAHEIMPRDFLTKSVRRIAPHLWQRGLDRHHRAILEAERGKHYDMVFFIQVHQLSQANLTAFRETFGQARFLLYNWDSIASHDYRGHAHAFDDIFTFDPDDAAAYGLKYLPLFCSRHYQGLDRRKQEPRTAYFVGNIVNPKRYAALERFRDYCRAHGISLLEHAACTPPAIAVLLRAGLRPRRVKMGPISPEALRAMVEKASATFDYANHHQSGYTMRVIENLCSGKKIITNNRRILREWFFSPDRIFVFDENNFEGVSAFLDQPLVRPDEDFPEFHVQSFVSNLLDGRGHDLPAAEDAHAPATIAGRV